MEFIVQLLQTANSLSPLAVIALLVVVIIMLVKRPSMDVEMQELRTNHLHELPEIAEALRRIENSLATNFSYIRARLNGRE